jgi:hypothetical protein
MKIPVEKRDNESVGAAFLNVRSTGKSYFTGKSKATAADGVLDCPVVGKTPIGIRRKGTTKSALPRVPSRHFHRFSPLIRQDEGKRAPYVTAAHAQTHFSTGFRRKSGSSHREQPV